jgi:hypothetical protein
MSTFNENNYIDELVVYPDGTYQLDAPFSYEEYALNIEKKIAEITRNMDDAVLAKDIKKLRDNVKALHDLRDIFLDIINDDYEEDNDY